MGRPSLKTPKLLAEICALMAQGLSLRKICARDDMPDMSSVFLWLSQDSEFTEQYARAREQQAEAIFEEIFEISDDGINDTYEDKDGNERTNHDVIARSKLRVDTRKWALSKMLPKKYGEKLQQDIDMTTRDAKLSDEQIAARLDAIFARAEKRMTKSEPVDDEDVFDLL